MYANVQVNLVYEMPVLHVITGNTNAVIRHSVRAPPGRGLIDTTVPLKKVISHGRHSSHLSAFHLT